MTIKEKQKILTALQAINRIAFRKVSDMPAKRSIKSHTKEIEVIVARENTNDL
jgi:hypothetical protein